MLSEVETSLTFSVVAKHFRWSRARLFILSVITASVPAVEARLGETPIQFADRYGAPKDTQASKILHPNARKAFRRHLHASDMLRDNLDQPRNLPGGCVDLIYINPPYDSDWFRKDDDVRWQWSEATRTGSPKGAQPGSSIWRPAPGQRQLRLVQHFIHHLAPHCLAGFVLVPFLFLRKIEGRACTQRFR